MRETRKTADRRRRFARIAQIPEKVIDREDKQCLSRTQHADAKFQMALELHHKDRAGVDTRPCTDSPRSIQPPARVRIHSPSGWFQ